MALTLGILLIAYHLGLLFLVAALPTWSEFSASYFTCSVIVPLVVSIAGVNVLFLAGRLSNRARYTLVCVSIVLSLAHWWIVAEASKIV